MCDNHDFSKERWLPIEGYEGYYEISDFGRVRSLDRYIIVLNRWGTYTPRLIRGRIKAQYVNEVNGYYQVGLARDGFQETRYPHELVLTHFVGKRPKGKEACHGPLGKSCNARINLEWNTSSVNNGEHKLRDGILLFGDTHPCAKLTEQVAREIFRRASDGESQASLAREFELSEGAVCQLLHGNSWQHLNLPPYQRQTSSKFRGVYWRKAYSTWAAQIGTGVKGKVMKHLGSFDDEIDAAKAYDAYVIEHGLDRPTNTSLGLLPELVAA